jgi:hypothetical protein
MLFPQVENVAIFLLYMSRDDSGMNKQGLTLQLSGIAESRLIAPSISSQSFAQSTCYFPE